MQKLSLSLSLSEDPKKHMIAIPLRWQKEAPLIKPQSPETLELKNTRTLQTPMP